MSIIPIMMHEVFKRTLDGLKIVFNVFRRKPLAAPASAPIHFL